ncbi:right-handed parallel beta-helix repeat-containing protein [Kineosporia sp. NBRC 101731]|uniref:right-handed parallel beta-helix repeat-containing protein n=1 Tax=Kineosporia sp. NBRC 101731 TaxID=3032199 RepID=UPI0024A408FB|nr:right-handed parallel beta-helix repeat-containing protein [Kineosporia sp. NBRC 101731]GLY27549.1 hypothetical protein Kisp02_09140 [Kineosporia sp. NBRC 101731]
MSGKAFLGCLGAAVLVCAGGAAPARADSPGDQVLAAKEALTDAPRQAELVAGEDQRVTRALVSQQVRKEKGAGTGAYRARSNGQYTLVLTARKRPYSFDDLRNLSPDKLIKQTDGSFLLREHVLVGPGATLSISPDKPLNLKMSSGPDGFVSIVTDGGRLRLNGTATAPISITSWDESHGRTDARLGDGRAYVRASGLLVASYTRFSRLGFWSGRTGGLAVGANSSLPTTNLSTSAATGVDDDPVAQRAGSHTDILPAGKVPSAARDGATPLFSAITNSSMNGNAFGLFVTGSSVQVADTVISNSLVDGLVLHRNVSGAVISRVTVKKSALDGVVVNRDVEATTLTQLNVHDNGRDGVLLNGSPFADGPSPSGASMRPFGNNNLSSSKISGNARIGVYVTGGEAITVQGNTVSGGHSGIVVSEGAREVMVNSNTVKDSAANGIQVRDGSKADLTSNNVIGAATGVHVRDAIASLRDNSTSGVTLHAFTFVGNVAGSVARDNALRGSGTSAVDTVRVSGEVPEVSDTDDSGWSRTVTKDSLVSILRHPLTMVWIGVAVLLLMMSRPRRGGTRAPYLADPLIGNGRPPMADLSTERTERTERAERQEREQSVNHPQQPGSRPRAQQFRPITVRSDESPPTVAAPVQHPVPPQPGRRSTPQYRPRTAAERLVPGMQPRPAPNRHDQNRHDQTPPGYHPGYSDPEPPVAAEWLQPRPSSVPRQKPEVRVDVRDSWDARNDNGDNTGDNGNNGNNGNGTPANGSTVIDLAIAQARANPVPSRRRRSVGR